MGVILAVVKNVGGTNAVLPVMDLLKEKHHIHWIAQEDGRGKEVLKSIGQNFGLGPASAEIYRDSVSAIISSTCSTVGRDLARFFKDYCPIIVIQDQWTAGLYDVWTYPEYRPDYILVNDKLDKSLVLKAWPDFNANHVKVTGYPAVDKYVNFDIQSAKTRVKNTLSLIKNKPIVLFAGQWRETGHAITELVRALNEIEHNIYLIARPHPAMKDNSPTEVPLWDKALAGFYSGTLISDSLSCSISDIIASSDLVLSMYSTALNEAAILRIPNIAILYPGHGSRLYTDVTKLEEYPMVSLGCTAKARNYEELVRLIKIALTSDIGLRQAQEKTFQLDGKNALRAAEFISSLI